MSVISAIESVELWASVVLSIVICALAAYYAFSLSRILFERIYRSRAVYTGFVAVGMIVLLVADSLTAIFTGSIRVSALPIESRIGEIVVTFALFLIIWAWLDSTIRIAIDQDYFHRDTLRWASFRYLFWASAIPSMLLFVLDPLVSYVFASIPLLYAAAAVLISGVRTQNKTMRAYLRWIGLLVFLASVFNLSLGLIPFPNLFPNLFPSVVVGYCLYRVAKSLTPTGKMEFELPKSTAAT